MLYNVARLVQAVQQDLAFAEAVSHRFAAGSALNPARSAAEEQYAQALVELGHTFNNSKALTIAAESYMNLSPWDYYAKVTIFVCCLSCACIQQASRRCPLAVHECSLKTGLILHRI